jgi:GNAT superfamily N-acetyltransferase
MSTVSAEPVTAEDLHSLLERIPTGRIQQRSAAFNGQGYLVGFNSASRDPWMTPGRFWIDVVTDPLYRKQDIGSMLYSNALQFAQEQGAVSLEAEVRDNMPEALGFAQKHGFQINRHLFESTLKLAQFDNTPFTGVIASVEASGIRFFTLADLGNTEEAQRKLYEINRRYALDIPGREQTYAPFAEFRKRVFAASWYRADAQIVAADGDKWIGLTAAGYFPSTNSMYNMITGVEPVYRGRKIALALKLLVIKCAQKYGAAYMRTNNDSENAPMLTVNRKLGYQPEAGKYLLLQHLTEMGRQDAEEQA